MSGTKIIKNYINGEWVEVKSAELLDVENPSTGDILAKVPLSTAYHVELAVDAARAAFPEWRRTPVTKRSEFMFTLQGILRKN